MRENDSVSVPAFELARRLLNQGARLLESGEARKAIPILEEACDLDSDSVPILISLGGAYIISDQHQRAIPLLEKARSAEPQNAMVWINLGAAYLGNRALATGSQQLEAIAAFEKALEIDPTAPSVHYNLGLIFMDRGDTDLALVAFRQAAKVNPHDRDAQNWIGKLEANK
jgi:tetratricopeptide (TPR) repeat protein